MKQTIFGYKVFSPDFKCKDFQYAENSEYKMEGSISICSRGFHFCIKAAHCFSYYDFNSNNIVCEVEALGETQTHSEDSKVVTNHIKIGRRLTWQEVLVAANTGHSNSGNSNSGYSNSGNSNSGNWNSGNWNSGNWNSGDSNSGYSNSGNRNSGNRNSGDRNSGNSNSGNWNSGDSNSGNWNSGNWNSGDRNSGDSNSGYRNSGAFCTDNDPKLYLFNKPCKKMTIKKWENSKAIELMGSVDSTLWIPFSHMNDKEKAANPKAETCEGYLKTIPIKKAWRNAWNNWGDENKKVFTSLENFSKEMFLEITGIDVDSK